MLLFHRVVCMAGIFIPFIDLFRRHLIIISGSLPSSASNARLLVETKIHLLRAGLWPNNHKFWLDNCSCIHSVARKIRRNKKWCKMLPRFCLLQFLYENKVLICLLLLFFVQSVLCSYVEGTLLSLEKSKQMFLKVLF